MRRVSADAWAGMIMLGVVILIGLPVMVGATTPDIPLGWWLVGYVLAVGGLIGAVWDGVSGSRSRLSLAVAVIASWAVVFAAPEGALVILLVVVAAIAVYVVPFPLVLVIVALNTAVLVVAWMRTGSAVGQALVAAVLCVFLQVASAMSCLSILREQRLRRELTAAHVELRAATRRARSMSNGPVAWRASCSPTSAPRSASCGRSRSTCDPLSPGSWKGSPDWSSV